MQGRKIVKATKFSRLPFLAQKVLAQKIPEGQGWGSTTVCSPCSYILSYVSTPVCFQSQMSEVNESLGCAGRVGEVVHPSLTFQSSLSLPFEKGNKCTNSFGTSWRVQFKHLILFAILLKPCEWY